MTWTPEKVFEHDADKLDAAIELLNEYEIRLKGISIPVKIRLYRNFGHSEISFSQSHFIHAPGQGAPYRTSEPWSNDTGSALHRAVYSCITQWYSDAVKAGHQPQDTWLVENPEYPSAP